MQFKLRIQPNSKKESFEQMGDGTFKLKIRTPPIEGRANERVIDILSQALDLPKSSIQILSGQKSKTKTIGLDWEGDINDLLRASWK